MLNKFQGCMIGMACGDALGAQVEFKARGTFPNQRDMTGKGPHNLLPGDWTDDTAMALALAEHLLSDPKLKDPHSLAMQWIDWWRDGSYSCTGTCFDIGNQTRKALDCWFKGRKVPVDENAKGNGSVMRVAPVALRWVNDPYIATRVARLQSQITHPSNECAEQSERITHAIRDALRTIDPHKFADLDLIGKSRDDVPSTGRALHTVDAALWCVANTFTFEDAVMTAVNLGDDADTTGAVTGALAGALYGVEAIPDRWLNTVAWRSRLNSVACELYEAVTK